MMIGSLYRNRTQKFVRFFITLLSGLFCLIATNGLKAQNDLHISSQLNKPVIMIGEHAIIDITIRTHDLDNTLLVLPNDSTNHQIEVLDFILTDTIDVEGTTKEIKAKMLVTTFDSTAIEIPPIGVKIKDQVKFATPLVLKVNMPDVDVSKPDQYFDIKSPWRPELKWYDYILIIIYHPITWIILSIGIIVVIILLLKRYRKHLKDKPKPVLIAKVKPIEQLRESISDLQPLVDNNEFKLFYNELINAFRSYLYDERNVPAHELTAREIYKELNNQQYELNRDLISAMQTWVDRSELVRFAKHKIDTSQVITDRDTIIALAEALERKIVVNNEESNNKV